MHKSQQHKTLSALSLTVAQRLKRLQQANYSTPMTTKKINRQTLLRQPAIGPYESELLAGLRAVFSPKSKPKSKSKSKSKAKSKSKSEVKK